MNQAILGSVLSQAPDISRIRIERDSLQMQLSDLLKEKETIDRNLPETNRCLQTLQGRFASDANAETEAQTAIETETQSSEFPIERLETSTLPEQSGPWNRLATGIAGSISASNSARRARTKAQGEHDNPYIVLHSNPAALTNLIEYITNAENRRLAISNQEEKLETAIHNLPRIMARPPADLTLLINPASQAIAAKQMIEALENPLVSECLGETPYIISVSSPGDIITRSLIPFAFRLGFSYINPKQGSFRKGDAGKTYKDLAGYPQRVVATHTAPHLDKFISHRVTSIGKNTSLPGLISKGVDPVQPFLSLTNLNVLLGHNLTPTNAGPVFDTSIGRFKIVEQRHLANHSRYWVLDVPAALIPSHGDFFQDNFYALTAALYRVTQGLQNSNAPPLQTEGIVRAE